MDGYMYTLRTENKIVYMHVCFLRNENLKKTFFIKESSI